MSLGIPQCSPRLALETISMESMLAFMSAFTGLPHRYSSNMVAELVLLATPLLLALGTMELAKGVAPRGEGLLARVVSRHRESQRELDQPKIDRGVFEATHADRRRMREFISKDWHWC